MTDSAASISSETPTEVSAKPAAPKPSPRPSASNRINRAKQIVVTNYNDHHNGRLTPRLTPAHVFIIAFTEVLDSWKATVGSPVVKGLVYEVTYNGVTGETVLDVYKRINNVRIPRNG